MVQMEQSAFSSDDVELSIIDVHVARAVVANQRLDDVMRGVVMGVAMTS